MTVSHPSTMAAGFEDVIRSGSAVAAAVSTSSSCLELVARQGSVRLAWRGAWGAESSAGAPQRRPFGFAGWSTQLAGRRRRRRQPSRRRTSGSATKHPSDTHHSGYRIAGRLWQPWRRDVHFPRPPGGRAWPPFPDLAAPPDRALALEGVRAAGELTAMGALIPLLRHAPKGDGHPVLVLPGFTAGDVRPGPCAGSSATAGYFTHGWRLGRNLGPTERMIDGMRARVEALLAQHGQRITIVGWSLGRHLRPRDREERSRRRPPGHHARARRSGSPAVPAPAMQSRCSSWFRRCSRRPRRSAWFPRIDGLACRSRDRGVHPHRRRRAWRSCVESTGPRRESIEVRGSHSGLGHIPAVLLTIADRLAQPEGTWERFGRRRPGAASAA